MQTVYWDDDSLPDVVISLENGDTQFFDYPHWSAFAIGDQIVHMSEIGPSVYRVIDVQHEYDEGAEYYGDNIQELRRVTIRAV